MAKARRRGYVPPYKSLIANDPLFGQLGSNLSAQGIADEGTRSADTRSGLIGFGEPIDIASSLQQLGLDPSSPLVAKLVADANASRQSAGDLTSAGLSTSAQLAHGHQQEMDALTARNAARGIRSGATGVGLRNEGLRYSGAQFDARNKVLQYLAGVQSAFADTERARQGQLATGAQDAATRQMALHPAIPGGAAPPPQAAAPPGTFTPVTVGSGTSMEPKPVAANFLQQPVPLAARTLGAHQPLDTLRSRILPSLNLPGRR